MSSRFLLSAVVTVSILFPAGPLAHAGDDAPKAAETAPAAPITEAECAAFGEEIAKAINTGDSAAVLNGFDPFTLAGIVLKGLTISDKDRREFTTSFATSVRESLGRELPKFTKSRFLRVQTVDGELRPLVRFVTSEGAMNFYAFVVARRPNGKLKWVDAHVYLTGELMSASTRRLVLPAFAAQNAGFLARLTGGENAYLKGLPQIQKAQEKLRAGDLAGAKEAFAALPPEVRSNKLVLMLRVQAAQQEGGDAYLAVLDEWERAFPGDPSLDLVGLDADFMRKDYAGVVRRLESLGRSLGGDPYLDFLKANMLFLAGRFDECRAAARAALAADPSMANVYDVLLQLELNANDHGAVAVLLDEVEATFSGSDMEAAIAADESYAAFRSSAEYRAWKARRADRHAVKVQ